MNLFSKLFALLFLLLAVLGIPRVVFAAEEPLGIWFSTSPLPYLLASHASFGFADKVSVVGGSAVTGQSKFNVLTATPSATGDINEWTTTSLTPTALIWHSLVTKNNFVYILGGREENPGSSLDHVSKVFVGDSNNGGTVDSWTQINSLPQGTSLGKAAVVGNRIYYAGGFNDGGVQDEVYYASINPDGTLGPWTTSSVSLPEPLFGFGMVEYQNNIIIVGGFNGSVFRNKTYKASVNPDGTISSWTETSTLPEPVYRSGVIRIGSTLISVGSNQTTLGNKVFYVDINSDGTLETWQTSANTLPQAVGAAGIAYSNGYLYLTGGFNGAYLDTVYYAPVNVNLPVPYYSQNVLPWGPTEYDHAQSIGLSPITMDIWGCVVTSAAMVLNYHNMTEFEDGTPIDPGNLNQWLKNNNGFQTSKPGFGKPFSKFDWSSINRLTKELFSAGKADYKLIHNRPKDSVDKDAILQDDLSNKKTPGILGVANADTDMHFVVAKGFDSDTYFINDPEWNYSNLQAFSDDFFQLDRYLKSSTNFSYIEMSTNGGIEIAVVDSGGRKSGKQVINGVIEVFDEIPNAVYSHQNAISNPNATGGKENFGFGFNEFLLPEPTDGHYTIILSSLGNQTYTLNIAALEADGDDKNFQTVGIIGQNSGDKLALDYSQNDPSSLDEIITFDSLISDINSLYSLKEIKKSFYKEILKDAKKAKKEASKGKKGKKKAVRILREIKEEIKEEKGEDLSINAFNILNADIQSLLTSLSP